MVAASKSRRLVTRSTLHLPTFDLPSTKVVAKLPLTGLKKGFDATAMRNPR